MKNDYLPFEIIVSLIIIFLLCVLISITCPIESTQYYNIVAKTDTQSASDLLNIDSNSMSESRKVTFYYKEGELIKEKQISISSNEEIIYIPSNRNAIRYTENTERIIPYELGETNVVVEYIEK